MWLVPYETCVWDRECLRRVIRTVNRFFFLVMVLSVDAAAAFVDTIIKNQIKSIYKTLQVKQKQLKQNKKSHGSPEGVSTHENVVVGNRRGIQVNVFVGRDNATRDLFNQGVVPLRRRCQDTEKLRLPTILYGNLDMIEIGEQETNTLL